MQVADVRLTTEKFLSPQLQRAGSASSGGLPHLDDPRSVTTLVGVEQPAANGGDYVVVDGPLPVIKAEAKIDKLLKFVADGDIQMVGFRHVC
jgi:hypothetical protein